MTYLGDHIKEIPIADILGEENIYERIKELEDVLLSQENKYSAYKYDSTFYNQSSGVYFLKFISSRQGFPPLYIKLN